MKYTENEGKSRWARKSVMLVGELMPPIELH